MGIAIKRIGSHANDRKQFFNALLTFLACTSAMHVKWFANYLRNEHPQTVAVVLAHMDPRASGPILALLPAEMQGDVAHRMTILEAPNAETLKAVEAVWRSKVEKAHPDREGGSVEKMARLNAAMDAARKEISP